MAFHGENVLPLLLFVAPNDRFFCVLVSCGFALVSRFYVENVLHLSSAQPNEFHTHTHSHLHTYAAMVTHFSESFMNVLFKYDSSMIWSAAKTDGLLVKTDTTHHLTMSPICHLLISGIAKTKHVHRKIDFFCSSQIYIKSFIVCVWSVRLLWYCLRFIYVPIFALFQYCVLQYCCTRYMCAIFFFSILNEVWTGCIINYHILLCEMCRKWKFSAFFPLFPVILFTSVYTGGVGH